MLSTASLSSAAPKHPTLDDLLESVFAEADTRPNDVAIRQLSGTLRKVLGASGVSEISYGEFRDSVRAGATRLRKLGMQPGDGVVFAVVNSIEAMVLLCSVVLAGGTILAVDPGVGRALFRQRLSLVKARWVMANSAIYTASAGGPLRWALGLAGLELPELSSLDATFVRVGPWLPGVPKSIEYRELVRPLDYKPLPHAGHRAALMFFTSGTTAAPKIVEHTERSMGAACSIVQRAMALRPGEVVYSGIAHQVLSALLGGATVVIPPRGRDTNQFLQDLSRHGVTHTYAVPYQMARIVEDLEKAGQRLPAHLRCIILGSAPIHRAFLERLRKVCDEATDIWCVYAMSEMLPVTMVESREKLAFEGEGDLVGRPIAGARVEVADDQELIVSGPNLFQRYIGQEPVTAHRTGDLGRIDESGRVILLGRKKDMIIRGSFNIYPPLYEEALAAIEGVKACAMVGIDNADLTDEVVVVAVEPVDPTKGDEVAARVRRAIEDGSCDIDVQARPDHVVACQLPYGGRTMKLDRVALRKQLAAQLGMRAHA